jgi:UDPglucose 6-dehydrogenase
MLATGAEHDSSLRIVESAVQVNDDRAALMLRKIEETAGGVAGKTVAMLGLSFKPNTDDLRESPALKIADALLAAGASLRCYDPVAMDAARESRGDLVYAEDEYDACRGADLLVLATEWNQFRSLNLERVKKLLKGPVMVDLRNVYEPEEMRKLGFAYSGVGR